MLTAATHLNAFLKGKRQLSLTRLKKLSVLCDATIDRLVFNEYREQLAQEGGARPVPHLP